MTDRVAWNSWGDRVILVKQPRGLIKKKFIFEDMESHSQKDLSFKEPKSW